MSTAADPIRKWLMVAVAILLPFLVQTAFVLAYYSYEAPWVDAPKWLSICSIPASIASFVVILATLIPIRSLGARILIALWLSPFIAFLLWCFSLFLALAHGDGL
jgi:hypothetical protein